MKHILLSILFLSSYAYAMESSNDMCWHIVHTPTQGEKASKLSLYYGQKLYAEKYGNTELQSFRVIGPNTKNTIIIDDKEYIIDNESATFIVNSRITADKSEQIRAIHPKENLYASANFANILYIYDKNQGKKICIYEPKEKVNLSYLPQIVFLDTKTVAVFYQEQQNSIEIIEFSNKLQDSMFPQTTNHTSHEDVKGILRQYPDYENTQLCISHIYQIMLKNQASSDLIKNEYEHEIQTDRH